MTINLDSPLAARLVAWAKERFPGENLVLGLVLYAAALLCGRSGTAGAIPIGAQDAPGYFAAISFLLLLRVFDEHKDFAIDTQNHPQRVLQRGLITLGHLKVLGALAIALQLGASLAVDRGAGPVTLRWLLAFAYSCLMAVEFFVGAWLSQRLVLYAISHMVVLPLAILWMAQMGAGAAALPGDAYWLALLALLSGFSLEIGRKTWAPAQERPTVDSYSRSLGLPGAVAALRALSVGVAALLCARLPWFLAPGAVLGLIPPLLALRSFLAAPTAAAAKRVQGGLGVQSLLTYLLLGAAYVLAHGVTWR